MPLQKFISAHQDFPSDSRLWVYQANRVLTIEEVAHAQTKLTDFIQTWAAHGEKVKGNFAILHNTFIVLIADETTTKASGCSIDSSVAVIRELSTDFDVNFFDRFSIAYLDNNDINVLNKDDFAELSDKENLTVFNNAVATLEAFETKWQTPYKGSWQENFFAEKPSFGLSL